MEKVSEGPGLKKRKTVENKEKIVPKEAMISIFKTQKVLPGRVFEINIYEKLGMADLVE